MSRTSFFNFNLFDGKENNITAKAWFIVDDKTGKIVGRGEGKPPESDKQIDLGGKYVMPGFFNVHTHDMNDPSASDMGFGKSEAESAVTAYKNLRASLKSGVTFVRGCGDAYDIDIKIKKMQKEGKLKHLPHIMPAGKVFSMTGGHGDLPGMGYIVDSPDEMRKGVRTALKNGAENIKMMATGGVVTPKDFMGDPQLSVKEMKTGVTEAHHKGVIVAAHAEGNPGIQNALDAGVDSIEHGFYTNEKEARQMVRQNTYLTPTLLVEWAIVKQGDKLPKQMVKKAADAFKDTYKNLSKAFKLGVKFTLGTDAGNPFTWFDQSPKEFELLTKLGMSNFQAYQCSTTNSPSLCQVKDKYGTLEVSKYADFLVLDSNPLADIKSVQQKDKQVYIHGKREF